MFTGIIEEVGEIVATDDLGDAARLIIRGPVVTVDARHGDSIAVNGVCLTVVDVLSDGQFSADVMAETLNRSSLAVLAVGSQVNLERAAAVNSRLGGHIVQGHVDGTGAVISRSPSEHWEVVRIALPREISRYVVAKGSITVDGISLTVSALSDEPLGRRADDPDEPLGRRADDPDEPLGRRADDPDEPLGRRADDPDEPLGRRADDPDAQALTTLGSAAVGTPVNLEVDVIAKYVERLMLHKDGG
ncbi:MAG: riboflavin synthase [Mycobacterium sp.]|nr:riboflavin synthase [Mycobacterium sp.]